MCVRHAPPGVALPGEPIVPQLRPDTDVETGGPPKIHHHPDFLSARCLTRSNTRTGASPRSSTSGSSSRPTRCDDTSTACADTRVITTKSRTFTSRRVAAVADREHKHLVGFALPGRPARLAREIGMTVDQHGPLTRAVWTGDQAGKFAASSTPQSLKGRGRVFQ